MLAMNGPSSDVQTWVDLLSKEAGVSNQSDGRETSISVTPHTPLPLVQRRSRINVDERGQVEVLRSQVVSLLKEKQELIKKAQLERDAKEKLENELNSERKSTVTHNGNTDELNHSHSFFNTTSLELQISTLREALDATTREKNLLKQQLSQERAHSHIDTGLTDSCSDDELRFQLSEQQDILSKTERERDALRERLSDIETHRQVSMEQYQQEVETSVMEVTNQLEELLQLNQQLQNELTSLQNEKDHLTMSLQRETEARSSWEKEKTRLHQQLLVCERRTTEMSTELEHVKSEMLQQTTSSLTAIETLKAQLSESNESTNQIKASYRHSQSELLKLKQESKRSDGNLEEADRALLDLQHQLTLVRQERDSLSTRLGLSQAQTNQLKKEKKRLEDESIQLQGDLSAVEKENSSNDTELVAVRAQLISSEEQCVKIKKELSMLREFSQNHSQQQLENITQQLVHKSQELQESETDRTQLQSRVKKLENKLHEMAFNHEVSSTQLQDNMRNVVTNLNNTLTQLDSTQTSNTQLQQKILDLEEEVAGWRKQLGEREEVCLQLRELLEEKNSRIQELETNISKLHQELIQSSTATDDHTQRLVSQVHSLQESVKNLQEERDSLNNKLDLELEQNHTTYQTEKELREENSRLQDLLNTSLSLNENLQSSIELSQVESFDIKTPSSSSVSETKPSPGSLSYQYLGSPPKYTSQFTSPATEILLLKQQLAEARQTCLKLERQHGQDKTEMAKIHGSLQALVKIQDHLGNENKSIFNSVSTLEEERDAFKQEANQLGSELISVQDDIELMNTAMSRCKDNLIIQLEELVEQVNPASELHEKLSEHLCQLKERTMLETFKAFNFVFETLSSFMTQMCEERYKLEQHVESTNESLTIAEVESQRRKEEVVDLEKKVTHHIEQISMLKEQLEMGEKVIDQKKKDLVECQIELERMKQLESERDKEGHFMDGYKRDLETQFQAKLSVLREKLIERENEVSSLNRVQQELKENLLQAELTLDSVKTETNETRSEIQLLRSRLAKYEITFKTENGLLENEVNKQSEELHLLKMEAEEVEENSRITQSINESQQEELSKCESHVSQLQAEVEMLRARKTVITKYLLAHEYSQEETVAKDREELAIENEQLLMENDELRQELTSLSETTQHLNEVVEVLGIRLEEVQEEYEEEKELQQKMMDDERDKQLNDEKLGKIELESAHSQLKHHCNLLDTDLETERLKIRRVERERDLLESEMNTLKEQLTIAAEQRKEDQRSLQQKIIEREAVISEMQSTLERAVSDKEDLEKRLHNSSQSGSLDGSISNNKKVDKLKLKLKQQVRQTNHLRMKLGYCLSELRLHKQLKTELDTQISKLQNALTVSQHQYKQCFEKLLQAERLGVNHSIHL